MNLTCLSPFLTLAAIAVIVLMTITGFGLVIISNFWLLLALLLAVAAIPLWLRRRKQ